MRGYESLYNVVDHVKAFSVSIFRIRLVCWQVSIDDAKFLVLLISAAITRSLPTSSRETISESFYSIGWQHRPYHAEH